MIGGVRVGNVPGIFVDVVAYAVALRGLANFSRSCYLILRLTFS